MKLKSYWWVVCQWLSNTPLRSLDRAYKATKQMQNIHKYLLYEFPVPYPAGHSRQAILSYVGTGVGNSVFIVYCSVLECRISIYLLNTLNRFRLVSNIISSTPAGGGGGGGSCETEQVNRKLAWIEATLNDLDNWKWSSSPPREGTADSAGKRSSRPKYSGASESASAAGTVPSLMTRTVHRFRTELSQLGSSALQASIRTAEYQKRASPRIGSCFITCAILIPILLQQGLRSWIEDWWNTYQSRRILIDSREKPALDRLREVEELLWLDGVASSNPAAGDRPQDQYLADMKHERMIQLVEMCNEDSIQTILHLLTDITYFVILSASLISDEERLAFLNSRIREFFQGLSDTMKAFLILLLTDLCIGFHSPHGWGIIIDTFLEHLGFARNKYVISCFVSTFPVILDTVFKYWIFCYLNRISPSIVATYHTMNE